MHIYDVAFFSKYQEIKQFGQGMVKLWGSKNRVVDFMNA